MEHNRPVPEDIADLGPELWSMKVLGIPLESRKFVSSIMEEGVKEERRLWEAIPPVPDLQMCAMPPSASVKCAREHDEGIWTTAKALLNEVPGSGRS